MKVISTPETIAGTSDLQSAAFATQLLALACQGKATPSIHFLATWTICRDTSGTVVKFFSPASPATLATAGACWETRPLLRIWGSRTAPRAATRGMRAIQLLIACCAVNLPGQGTGLYLQTDAWPATANAPAGSRARGTSMGGLYVAATLHAMGWSQCHSVRSKHYSVLQSTAPVLLHYYPVLHTVLFQHY